jgi:hypothetical protein
LSSFFVCVYSLGFSSQTMMSCTTRDD